MTITKHKLIKLADEILNDLKHDFPQDAEKLNTVTFEISSRLRTTAGRAWNYGRVELCWSIFKEAENISEFRNTVVHEVAHVVVGTAHGHDTVWTDKFVEYGGSGERTHCMTAGVKRRKQQRFAACCAKCGATMQLTKTRVNKIAKGAKYKHSNCGGAIELSQ